MSIGAGSLMLAVSRPTRPMSKSIYSSFTIDGEAEANAELRRRGIPHSLGDLFHDGTLCPECGPALLDLFRFPLPFNVRAPLAQAVFARKLKPAENKEAFGILLALIKETPERCNSLSMLAWNELPDNVDPSRVHELGQMALDNRYGPLRSGFLMALRKIRNADAIGYLQRAARNPLTAALALGELARLRVEDTLQLCDQAIALPGVLHADGILETRAKLKRQSAKKQGTPSHVTAEPIPDGLKEWSSNLDGGDLPKGLRAIQKGVEGGFAKGEATEVRLAADDLSNDQDVRFKFDVKLRGRSTTLWLELFCDDGDAYDMYIFGIPELVDRIEHYERNAA